MNSRIEHIIEEITDQYLEKDRYNRPWIIGFSGGKDSTVTSDLVTRAFSTNSITHIFGDTTLEFPSTIEYARRYRDTHPFAIFQTAKNEEQDFYDVCYDIGPPARMMRWCCSMLKLDQSLELLTACIEANKY